MIRAVLVRIPQGLLSLRNVFFHLLYIHEYFSTIGIYFCFYVICTVNSSSHLLFPNNLLNIWVNFSRCYFILKDIIINFDMNKDTTLTLSSKEETSILFTDIFVKLWLKVCNTCHRREKKQYLCFYMSIWKYRVAKTFNSIYLYLKISFLSLLTYRIRSNVKASQC